MRNYFIGILFYFIFGLFLFASVPPKAFALLDFGGLVVSVNPICINGVSEVYNAPVRGSPPLLMSPVGLYTFAYGPPTHPNQWILGRYGPVVPCLIIIYVPCGFGVCPVIVPRSFGPLIIFNGSSL